MSKSSHKIEFAYLTPEIKEIYEKHGGFCNSKRLLFIAFHHNNELVTGIHMRGGLYGQVSKHIYCFFDKSLQVPDQFKKFVTYKDFGYCGIHATNLHFSYKRYKQKKKKEEIEKFKEYIEANNPLFSYFSITDRELEGVEISYQDSKELPYR